MDRAEGNGLEQFVSANQREGYRCDPGEAGMFGTSRRSDGQRSTGRVEQTLQRGGKFRMGCRRLHKDPVSHLPMQARREPAHYC